MVVLAGGLDKDSVEVFNLTDQTFSAGPSMPYALQDTVSVPFGESFILVGGRTDVQTDTKGQNRHIFVPSVITFIGWCLYVILTLTACSQHFETETCSM